MKRVIVVTDSTAGMPADLAAQNGVHVIPLWVHFEETGYRDGVDLTTEQFYPMLSKARNLPTSSWGHCRVDPSSVRLDSDQSDSRKSVIARRSGATFHVSNPRL